MTDLPPHRPWRRRIAITLAIGALFLVATYYYLSTAWQRDLAAAVAEAERDTSGWRLAEIEAARAVVPPEDNSSDVVVLFKSLHPPAWPVWYMGPSANAPDAIALDDQPAFEKRFRELPPNVALDAEQERVLRAEVTRAACAVNVARSLAALKPGRHPLTIAPDGISTLLPRTQDSRTAAALLEPDILLRAHDEDWEGALESCRAILGANRTIGDEPFMISGLVRVAIRAIAIRKLERILAQGEPPLDLLTALEPILDDEDNVPLLLYGARGDRGMIDHLWDAVQNGQVTRRQLAASIGPLQGGGKKGLFEDLKMHVSSLAVPRCRAESLKLMNRFVELARLPPEKRAAPMTALETDLQTSSPIVRHLCQASTKYYGACQRGHVDLRCGRTLIALERFRRAEGRWPDTLSELTPRYLANVPLDPFDGQPLRYRRRADGVTVYSVGVDGADDGGNVWPISVNLGTDWGYRLWNVSERRKTRTND